MEASWKDVRIATATRKVHSGAAMKPDNAAVRRTLFDLDVTNALWAHGDSNSPMDALVLYLMQGFSPGTKKCRDRGKP